MSADSDRIDPAPLVEVLGRELELGALSRVVGGVVGARPWPVVGALHITCADEAQHRVIDVFQELLVTPYVTAMASGERTAFRLVNLGGHHEPGALDIAENHWAGAHDVADGPKLMVARVDAHVGVYTDDDDRRAYGRFLRYNHSSPACGALAAVLRGVAMRGSEGFVDTEIRARRILDCFPEQLQMLAAAVCRAELSALDLTSEARTCHLDSPTVWLIVATVTLNQEREHASLLTSVRVVDGHEVVAEAALGVDVTRYEITEEPTNQRAVIRLTTPTP